MAGFTFIFVTGVLGCFVSASSQHPRDAPAGSSLASSRVACGSVGSGVKEAVELPMWWLEEGISGCPEEEWLCMDSTKCIPRNATCSGVPECADGSDESPRYCGCQHEEFQCGDACIPCVQRCDTVKHCLHGEDEQDCLSHRCPVNYHQCESDGTCVPISALCNYTNECADASDEKPCNKTGYRKCYNSEFRCDNGECMRPYAVCDGYYNCKDGSDEKDCDATEHFVTCKSGKKIHKYWHCNNSPDCSENYFHDDSDELSCDCTKDQFKCSSGRCIYKAYKCDAKCDCFNTCEDEENCSHVYTNVSGVVECLPGRAMECDGRCIARQYVCDGILHCPRDNVDELGCYDHTAKRCIFPETVKQEKMYFFQCADLRCLPIPFMCNGRRDCVDGDDEAHCGKNGACRIDELRCLNGSCIPLDARCDGIEDCRYGLDEQFCDEQDQPRCSPDEWPCVSNRECVRQSQRCDREINCKDQSDEQYCADNTCAEGQWQCSSGHCVPEGARCDAVFDCEDKSDEKDCGLHACGTLKKCWSGQCVPLEAWCNGTAECPDLSDEQNCAPPRECTSDEWRCRNGQCVPLEHRCMLFSDDRHSCLDRSHLLNCTDAKCGEDKFKCYKGPCIDGWLRCDGHANCPDTWDDEDNCPFQCSRTHTGCRCLDQSINCSFVGMREFPHVEDKINRYLFAHNHLGQTLHLNHVHGHGKAIYLDLCHNNITQLGNGTLSDLELLMNLLLCHNYITAITYGNFRGLINLRGLDLTDNHITYIGPRAFHGLVALPKLDLSHQYISEIAGNAFRGLDNLKTLLLSHNHLTSITNPDTFAGLPRLVTLLLSHNRLTTISHPDTFAALPLLHLDIDANPLDHVDEAVFQPLQELKKLSTPEFRFCCLPHHAQECLPLTDEFSSCEDLMSNLVLRVFVWVVGFVALIGNTFVIIWRLLYPSGSKKNHSLLFVNLALGDLLMGVYLLVIAGVDLTYRGVYRVHERGWRSSPLCQTAGFLSTFSSEASVFTLTVITLDRLTILVSPYGVPRVHEGLAKRVMVGVWVIAFLLAALPLISSLPYFDNFYGRSGVCLALHITNEKPNGWEYSVFIFLVLNLLSFAVIAVSYVLIYITAREKPLMESGKNKHGKDREMGRRVTYIVGTDAACWLPIIMLGIASLSGAQIPRKVFSWVAVFVLPLNAALNPLLYTFFTEPVRKRLKDLRESFTSWQTRSTRSTSVVSGVRMASTYRGRVTTEVTDIPITASDGKVHTKAAICVYTPATTAAAASQVTHFIHEPPDQGEAARPDECTNRNGGDAVQVLTRPRTTPASKVMPTCEAKEEAIVPLETLTADRPAVHRNSGRHNRRKNTADRRYD